MRVGGNTQDKAILNVNGNPSGRTIEKYKGADASPTETPDVHFTLDLFYAMAQITKLVNVDWFFGIPFIDVDADGNAGLVVQNARSILGDSLLGLQMANEPDLYVILLSSWSISADSTLSVCRYGPHLKKQADYSVQDFFNDTSTVRVVQRMLQSLRCLHFAYQMIQRLPITDPIIVGPRYVQHHLLAKRLVADHSPRS